MNDARMAYKSARGTIGACNRVINKENGYWSPATVETVKDVRAETFGKMNKARARLRRAIKATHRALDYTRRSKQIYQLGM